LPHRIDRLDDAIRGLVALPEIAAEPVDAITETSSRGIEVDVARGEQGSGHTSRIAAQRPRARIGPTRKPLRAVLVITCVNGVRAAPPPATPRRSYLLSPFSLFFSLVEPWPLRTPARRRFSSYIARSARATSSSAVA